MSVGTDFDPAVMQAVDVRTVDPDTLTDIREVNVDPHLPSEERLREFLRQIGNPYCFRCGKMIVKISHAESGATLEERLEAFFREG